eukprot:NODE_22503_length_705_cov_5.413495.p1 GENE.NODE_22503_length_705_cov_5.413495~~NODE_22503_length_705_cov_5.413495.p1  ORF type:complete len:181 (-),score=44.44 NODE_22503_length_705_cov_5.413495:163-672(-)
MEQRPQRPNHIVRGEDGGALVDALRHELRAQRWLLTRPDALKGLKARCFGEEVNSDAWSENIQSNSLTRTVERHILAKDPAAETEAFRVWPRVEFPLSQHPRLRRYHPDYDADTGMDHDPVHMANEMRRWSPDFFKEERRRMIEELLGGNDPALYGESRWVRVEREYAE